MQDAESQRFRAVKNGAGDFSIWPEERPVPAGWFDAGAAGFKADCLRFIEREWKMTRGV